MTQHVLLFVGCPHSCTQLCSAISGEGVKHKPIPLDPINCLAFDRDEHAAKLMLPAGLCPKDLLSSSTKNGYQGKGAGSKGPICNL